MIEKKCNKCGRLIENDGVVFTQDFLGIRKAWGYFSKKDLQIHEFAICEECYDELIRSFVIPVEIHEQNEI